MLKKRMPLLIAALLVVAGLMAGSFYLGKRAGGNGADGQTSHWYYSKVPDPSNIDGTMQFATVKSNETVDMPEPHAHQRITLVITRRHNAYEILFNLPHGHFSCPGACKALLAVDGGEIYVEPFTPTPNEDGQNLDMDGVNAEVVLQMINGGRKLWMSTTYEGGGAQEITFDITGFDATRLIPAR